MRKLQGVKESPLGRTVTRGLDGIVEENEPQGKRRVEEEDLQEELRLRKKELEAQKARIVAQMAPVKEEQEEHEYDEHDEVVKRREKYGDKHEAMGNTTTTTVPQKREYRVKEEKVREAREARVDKENMQATGVSCGFRLFLSRINKIYFSFIDHAHPHVAAPAPPSKPNGFDAAAQTLLIAFDAKGCRKSFFW